MVFPKAFNVSRQRAMASIGLYVNYKEKGVFERRRGIFPSSPWIFYYVPLKRQTSEMTSSGTSVGFGRTQIDPWDIIRLALIELIDSDMEIRREVFTLSESKIPVPDEMKNGTGFFRALEDYFKQKRDDMVEYLNHLASEIKLHIDEGSTSVTSILEDYRRQCNENDLRLIELGIRQTCSLVGRDHELENVIESLQSVKYKGVWICGLGGMGKTSLAFEVCRRLFGEKWRIYNVELREQKYVRDLVRTALNVIDASLLTSSGDGFSGEVLESHATGSEDDTFVDYKEESWKQLLVQKCCEHSDQNQVLLLDNVDEILASDETSFYALLKRILERRMKVENCPDHAYGMYRFLITSRSRFDHTRLEGSFQEIQLRELTEKQAIIFLEEKSKLHNVQLPENEMKKVTSLCGCCPLAMLSVLGALQDIRPRDLILSLQSNDNSVLHVQSDVLGVELCLRQSFSFLNERYKITLMQLSVFRTTNFSIEAAIHVCGKNGHSGKANMQLEMVSLKKRHFIETPIGGFSENGQAQPPLSETYYVHPLVYQFLRNHQSMFENYVNDARSRFVEYIDRVISKTGDDSLSNLMKVTENYEPHIKLFYDYLTQMPSIRPSFVEDVPSLVSVMNRERLTDLVLDDASKHKHIIQMISESKAKSNDLETMFYQTSLAKFYIDRNNIDMCMELLEEMEDIVKSNENFSKEADYIKRKRISKNHSEALILSRFWTVQAQFLNANENYDEAIDCLKYALMAIKKSRKECWSFMANIKNLVGIIYFKCKEYHHAERFHIEALEIVTSRNKFTDKDIYLTNIGNAKFKQSEQDVTGRESLLQDTERYYNMALNLETTQRNNKAKILSLRGKLYLRLLKLEDSENDLQESLNLWKTLVDPPNLNLISAYHSLSTLLLRKCTHLLEKDKVNEVSTCLTIVLNNYTEIQKQMAEGGLQWQRNKVLYKQIKQNHKRVLVQLNREKEEIDEMKRFYLDFEAGKFDKFSRKEVTNEKNASSDSIQVGKESMDSDSLDSSSLLSTSSSLSVTSEDEELNNKLFSKTPDINDSLEKSCPVENSYRNQIDSGLGGSVNSPSFSAESDFKEKFWTSESSSAEEEVFSLNDNTRTNCEHIKRKPSDESKTCMIKRQKIII